MEEILNIKKSRVLPEALNFDFLRATGLKHIEDLSSKIWTDYNTHDPGVTILEALCYAITELSYRTDFDIKDLMADADGNINTGQAFFSAKNILTASSLTIEDYRKILVDIVGVKNAWLYPYRDEDTSMVGEPDQEIDIFAHCKKDKLVYEETEHPVKLHGLYSVLLELEETDEFGDLNTGDIVYEFAVEGLTNTHLQIMLPGWKGTTAFDYEFIAAANPASITNISVVFSSDRWKVKFDITSGVDTHSFEFEAVVLLKKNLSAIGTLITGQFNDANQLIEIFTLYQKKIQLIISILNEAKLKLHNNRNLCEDFIKLETICTQSLAFCADIEVKPDADIEEVYANVLYQLENYLNPEVKFYTLKELLDEGTRTEEIFEGPLLRMGSLKQMN